MKDFLERLESAEQRLDAIERVLETVAMKGSYVHANVIYEALKDEGVIEG